MAVSSTLDPTFGTAGADRFRALLRRIVPLAVAFGLLELVLGAFAADAATAALGIITVGYGAWLLTIATRLGHWPIRRVVLAAWMPILPLAVVAAALQPLAVPALTIVPLVAAAATLPFEPDPRRIRRLMVVTGLSAFGVIVVGAVEPLPTMLPASLHHPFIVASAGAAIGLFLFLLSQFSWRLREALSDAVRMTLELDEAHRERRRLDRQLHEARRAESLATLAGGVAHDFNNLLTAIIGNADLALLDLEPSSPVRPSVEAIKLAGGRAAELGRLMRAYSSGTPFAADRIAVPGLIDDLRPVLAAALPAGVALVGDLDPAAPEIVGDPVEIRRVVEHLVTNAGEAVGERAAGEQPGVVTVRVAACEVSAAELESMVGAQDPQPGRWVVVTVEDNGPGVPAALRGRILEPFFSTRFTGRGLGLAAVLGIVRGHRGLIAVDDSPGGGARFRILLPPA
jgi:signal transduction histidine kinase